MSVGTYNRVRCVCGRLIGANNIRQHRRKCDVQLEKWKRDEHPMYLLDDRRKKP